MRRAARFLLGLVVLCLMLPAIAQQSCQDVLYLKNGSVIRGMVTELVPDGSVRIQTADGSLFVFTMAEVERMTKEEVKTATADGAAAKPADLSAGYQGIAEVGYAVGMAPNGVDQFKFNFINGYRFNRRLMAGLGLGLRMYLGEGDTYAMVPIFLDGRFNFLDRNTSPYLSLGVGMTFNGSHDLNTEGLLVSGGLGVAFRMRGRTQLHAGLGADLQKLIVYDLFHSSSGEPLFAERHVDSGALSFNVGISF